MKLKDLVYIGLYIDPVERWTVLAETGELRCIFNYPVIWPVVVLCVCVFTQSG